MDAIIIVLMFIVAILSLLFWDVMDITEKRLAIAWAIILLVGWMAIG